MDQSPALEANSRSARQEIPRLLWNCKAHSKVLCNISKSTRFPRSEVVSRHRNSQAGRPPIFGCRRLLTQYTRSSPPISGRRILHPEPRDRRLAVLTREARRDSDQEAGRSNPLHCVATASQSCSGRDATRRGKTNVCLGTARLKQAKDA
jgi:hypothetical protein